MTPGILFGLPDIEEKNLAARSLIGEPMCLFPGYGSDRGEKLHPFHNLLHR
jgi:hypothetical protein